MGMERGHQVLHIVGKGAKPALIPLVPRTARTIDLAVGERQEGPILVRQDGHPLDRRTAHRCVQSMAKRAGLGLVHPHMQRAGFIIGGPRRRVPLREVQVAARHADPRTTTVYDRRRQDLDRHVPGHGVRLISQGAPEPPARHIEDTSHRGISGLLGGRCHWGRASLPCTASLAIRCD
jgi:integrase